MWYHHWKIISYKAAWYQSFSLWDRFVRLSCRSFPAPFNYTDTAKWHPLHCLQPPSWPKKPSLPHWFVSPIVPFPSVPYQAADLLFWFLLDFQSAMYIYSAKKWYPQWFECAYSSQNFLVNKSPWFDCLIIIKVAPYFFECRHVDEREASVWSKDEHILWFT